MNGRIYDPYIARFMSADPIIPDVFDGQSLNRFSYVNNNPLSFTDPTGFVEIETVTITAQAIKTGNPYVIAAAVVIDIAAAILGLASTLSLPAAVTIAATVPVAFVGNVAGVPNMANTGPNTGGASPAAQNPAPESSVAASSDATTTAAAANTEPPETVVVRGSRSRPWAGYRVLSSGVVVSTVLSGHTVPDWCLAAGSQCHINSIDHWEATTVDRTGDAVIAASRDPIFTFWDRWGGWLAEKMFYAQVAAMGLAVLPEGMAAAPGLLPASKGFAGEILQTPKVASQKLKNIVNDLYKGTTNPARIGNGTTMDAVRFETRTGRMVGNKWHTLKAKESINGLTNWLKANPGTGWHDKVVAQSLLDELQSLFVGVP